MGSASPHVQGGKKGTRKSQASPAGRRVLRLCGSDTATPSPAPHPLPASIIISIVIISMQGRSARLLLESAVTARPESHKAATEPHLKNTAHRSALATQYGKSLTLPSWNKAPSSCYVCHRLQVISSPISAQGGGAGGST
ncbi:unnamed protein product [Boreogadus saida]